MFVLLTKMSENNVQIYVNQYCNGVLADFGSITKDLDYDYYWWN